MSDTKPLLSISLLSSGRSATIERCLSSLTQFKEQLEIEIIIADTDPNKNENIRAILEKYADKIFHYTWNDDFSAARNACLDVASGEWFMFIDDDEWFINAQPIIDFLQSEEKDMFHYATYLVRNYFDEELISFRDAWASRLFKREPDVCFHSPIHEYFAPLKGEPKNIQALVGHTGYVYRTKEERQAHSKRNLNSVLSMMEKEPNEIRWVIEAILEYGDVDDSSEKQLELARKGYRMMDGAKGYAWACVRGYFAACEVRLFCAEERYQECYDSYRRIMRDKKRLGDYSNSYISLMASKAALETGMTRKSVRHISDYLSGYKALVNKPVKNNQEQLDFLMVTFDPQQLGFAMDVLLNAIHVMETESKADTNGIPEEASSNIRGETNDKYFKKAFETLSDMVSVYWSGNASQNVVQEFLLGLDKERTQEIDSNDEEIRSAQAAESKYWFLVRAVAEMDVKKGIPLDLIIIWDDHKGLRENMPSYFSRVFSNMNPLLLDEKLWRIGIRRGAALDDRIREIPMDTWQRYVIEFISENTPAGIRSMSKIMDEVYFGTKDPWYDYFFKQSNQVLLMAEQFTIQRKAEQRANEKQKELQMEISSEMNDIIAKLENKVDDLVGQGLLEEADMVLKEIQKYTSLI